MLFVIDLVGQLLARAGSLFMLPELNQQLDHFTGIPRALPATEEHVVPTTAGTQFARKRPKPRYRSGRSGDRRQKRAFHVMNPLQPLRTTIDGYRIAAPAERAGFEMLGAFATTIAVSRATNYVRERRRRAPLMRSLIRRTYHAPGANQLRVHHYLPGIGLTLAAGAASILTRKDRRELWLSLPFGTGAALTLDEADLLVELDNPYWGSQVLALAQGSAAALGAAALGVRFYRRGSTMSPRLAARHSSVVTPLLVLAARARRVRRFGARGYVPLRR